jgi:hypothetical protein
MEIRERERERVTTCRVGVHVTCLARHVEQTGRPYYAGQMSRELNAPVRIAELAISGASADASGRRHPHPPHPAWKGSDSPGSPHTWIVLGVRGGTSRLTTTQLPGQAWLPYGTVTVQLAAESESRSRRRRQPCPSRSMSIFLGRAGWATSRWEGGYVGVGKERGGSETTATWIVAVSQT